MPANEAEGGVDDLVCIGSMDECRSKTDALIPSFGTSPWYLQIAEMGALKVVARGSWEYRANGALTLEWQDEKS